MADDSTKVKEEFPHRGHGSLAPAFSNASAICSRLGELGVSIVSVLVVHKGDFAARARYAVRCVIQLLTNKRQAQPCCRSPDFTSLWGANQFPHPREVNTGETARFCRQKSASKPLTVYQKGQPNRVQPTNRGENLPVGTAIDIRRDLAGCRSRLLQYLQTSGVPFGRRAGRLGSRSRWFGGRRSRLLQNLQQIGLPVGWNGGTTPIGRRPRPSTNPIVAKFANFGRTGSGGEPAMSEVKVADSEGLHPDCCKFCNVGRRVERRNYPFGRRSRPRTDPDPCKICKDSQPTLPPVQRVVGLNEHLKNAGQHLRGDPAAIILDSDRNLIPDSFRGQ